MLQVHDAEFIAAAFLVVCIVKMEYVSTFTCTFLSCLSFLSSLFNHTLLPHSPVIWECYVTCVLTTSVFFINCADYTDHIWWIKLNHRTHSETSVAVHISQA